MASRQQARRELFNKFFQKMTGAQRGQRSTEDSTIMPMRAERRKPARAFATGEWRRISAAPK